MIDVCSSSCLDSGDYKYETIGINLNIGDIITEDIENDDWCTDYDNDEIIMTI